MSKNRDERREKLRLLDGCLDVLEEDHQRGKLAVSAPVAAMLRPYVASVAPGMLISEAIERVFTEQEPYLAPEQPDDEPSDGAPSPRTPPAWLNATSCRPASRNNSGSVPPLNEEGARALTERIRSATQHVCMLLMEAHDGRAWSALGYRTWEQYVKREFGLSRSRSYELLDQGRVIAELQSAAGISEIPDISAYAASQIKPYLSEVARNVRDRASRHPVEQVRDLIGEIVAQQRTRIRALRAAHRERGLGEPGRQELGNLYTAIECLATMPDPAGTAARISLGEAPPLAAAEPALQWLSEFVDELRRRSRADIVA